MIGHLGSRASALLDGRMTPAEEERAWSHVHGCHACRDLVEREGWIKTQLAGWSVLAGRPVTSLKDRLLADPVAAARYPNHPPAVEQIDAHRRPGVALFGVGAVGAAMLGVLALGAAPASAPTLDRRLPAGSIGGVQGGPPTPVTPRSTAPHRTRTSHFGLVSGKMAG